MCSQKYTVRHSESHNNRNLTLGAFLCVTAGRRLNISRSGAGGGLVVMDVALLNLYMHSVTSCGVGFCTKISPSQGGKDKQLDVGKEEKGKRRDREAEEEDCIYTSSSAQLGVICKYLTYC